MEKAKRLLEMERISVSEASSLVGYSNFSKATSTQVKLLFFEFFNSAVVWLKRSNSLSFRTTRLGIHK